MTAPDIGDGTQFHVTGGPAKFDSATRVQPIGGSDVVVGPSITLGPGPQVSGPGSAAPSVAGDGLQRELAGGGRGGVGVGCCAHGECDGNEECGPAHGRMLR